MLGIGVGKKARDVGSDVLCRECNYSDKNKPEQINTVC